MIELNDGIRFLQRTIEIGIYIAPLVIIIMLRTMVSQWRAMNSQLMRIANILEKQQSPAPPAAEDRQEV
ncbi:MAG: hypothetical protein ACOCTI_04760 [Phycisphaeraceae bacterium]